MKRMITVLMVLSGILAGASAYAQTEEQTAIWWTKTETASILTPSWMP